MTIAEDDHANGKRITVLDAPSNLGLRPPADDCVPGVYKLAGALRDTGLLERLGAADGGVVVPPATACDPRRPGSATNVRSSGTRSSSRLVSTG
jgi:hypothetical protein